MDGWTKSTLQSIVTNLDRNFITASEGRRQAESALGRKVAGTTKRQIIRDTFRTERIAKPHDGGMVADSAVAYIR